MFSDVISDDKYKKILMSHFAQVLVEDYQPANSGTFSVKIPDNLKDEYYTFLFKEKILWASSCLREAIMDSDGRKYIGGLITKINKEHLIF